jgi:ABC-2 type transport system permease protein
VNARASGAIGRPRWLASARVLIRLAWVRTTSPLVLLGTLGLLLLPLLFAALFASQGSLSGDPVEFLVRRYDQLVGALATPVLALLLGTSAFSAEREDGTLVYLITTPTPRWWIVTVRLLWAAGLTGALSSLAVWGAGAIAAHGSNPEGVTSAYTVAVFFGGVAYAALFTLLGVRSRRPLVTGLLYVLFWEGALSGTFQALNFLSIRQWMLAVTMPLTTARAERLEGVPSAPFALVAAAVLLGTAVHLGARALDRLPADRSGN